MPKPEQQFSTEQRLVLRRPDDWHVHLRDDAMLKDVARFTASQFARAIVMPNLSPPVTTGAAAAAYRDRILAAVPEGMTFEPLMTLFLTDHIDPEEVERSFTTGVVTACKLYPVNATTNSSDGVSDILGLDPVFTVMQRIGMPLLIHGEVSDRSVDVFDREAAFIEQILKPLLSRFPELKVVFEHITTRDAVDFVRAGGPKLAATITPHHLAIDRNAMFDGGIQPHHYCLPIPKRATHRAALRAAATSGSPKFFLGTDSAPHPIGDKESACGCAGIFNAPFALESYAQTFEEEGALAQLEGFASEFGPNFYGLPLNEERVILERGPAIVPAVLPLAAAEIVPFMAAQTMDWRYAGSVTETG